MEKEKQKLEKIIMSYMSNCSSWPMEFHPEDLSDMVDEIINAIPKKEMKVKFSKYAVRSAIDRLEGIEDHDFEMISNRFNINVHACEAVLQKLLEKDILMKMGPEVEAEVELSEKEVTLLFNLVL